MDASKLRRTWLDQLRPGSVQGLFEFLPDTLYFAKDAQLRLMAGNRAFVERCGFTQEDEIIGLSDYEIFPPELAEKYHADDERVLTSLEPLMGIVELFPDRVGDPVWFITDKIPFFDQQGKGAGLCGIVRSFEGAHASLQPYLELLPVIEFLKENYAQKISMLELAKLVGMSVRKLQRRFNETFKTTLQFYIARLRILKACELLLNTQLQITEIALEIGFYDHSVFSRKFSEMMGVSPRAYRKRFEPPTESRHTD
jgi:PAS domain S-box-containing protein